MCRQTPPRPSFQECEPRSLRSHNAYVTIVRLCPSNPAPSQATSRCRTVRRNSGKLLTRRIPTQGTCRASPSPNRLVLVPGTRRAPVPAAPQTYVTQQVSSWLRRRGAACRADEWKPSPSLPCPKSCRRAQAELYRRRRPRSCRGSGRARRSCSRTGRARRVTVRQYLDYFNAVARPASGDSKCRPWPG